MNITYDIKKVIEHNRYAILVLYPFDADPTAPYYADRGSTCYDMYILGHLLGYLRLQITTRENIIKILNTEKFMAVGGDLDCFYAHYNSVTNILRIGGEYADYQDQAYFEKSFPHEKSKNFLDHEYSIPLDTFLNLAEKMKLLFDLHTHWVILYEDEFGKLHLEQYDKKIDYL